MMLYGDIICCINSDLNNLDEYLKKSLKSDDNNLSRDLYGYIFNSSKRIRSALLFLLVRALGAIPDKKVFKIACAAEIIHNATLIHDDIIDDADLRRGNISLNYKYNSKLSVIAGDFLLSLALKEMAGIKDTRIVDTFAKSLNAVCKGEINQYFEKDKLLDIPTYLEKSKYKTSELFKAVLISGLISCNKQEYEKEVSNFSDNFGIAFQVRDDLINITQTDKTKPCCSDFFNGIYTAPVIYALEGKNAAAIKTEKEILEIIKNTNAEEKTKQLIRKHINLAIDSLKFLRDNQYKENIISLCRFLEEDN